MIVIENSASSPVKMHDHFKRSVEAYWALKEWCKTTEDSELKRAIKEMMYDEYLHARYMRKYLKLHNMYTGNGVEELEKKFLLIEDDD